MINNWFQESDPARHKKYHSGTICKGVSNPHTSNALSGEINKR